MPGVMLSAVVVGLFNLGVSPGVMFMSAIGMCVVYEWTRQWWS